MTMNRRRFLGLGACVATGVAGAGAAHGFQLQDMSVPTERAYRLACEAPANHAQLLAEIDAQLAGRKLSDAEIARIRNAARCPLCGCPLAASEPQAADRPS
jgi:hypothetical protein